VPIGSFFKRALLCSRANQGPPSQAHIFPTYRFLADAGRIIQIQGKATRKPAEMVVSWHRRAFGSSGPRVAVANQRSSGDQSQDSHPDQEDGRNQPCLGSTAHPRRKLLRLAILISERSVSRLLPPEEPKPPFQPGRRPSRIMSNSWYRSISSRCQCYTSNLVCLSNIGAPAAQYRSFQRHETPGRCPGGSANPRIEDKCDCGA